MGLDDKGQWYKEEKAIDFFTVLSGEIHLNSVGPISSLEYIGCGHRREFEN